MRHTGLLFPFLVVHSWGVPSECNGDARMNLRREDTSPHDAMEATLPRAADPIIPGNGRPPSLRGKVYLWKNHL